MDQPRANEDFCYRTFGSWTAFFGFGCILIYFSTSFSVKPVFAFLTFAVGIPGLFTAVTIFLKLMEWGHWRVAALRRADDDLDEMVTRDFKSGTNGSDSRVHNNAKAWTKDFCLLYVITVTFLMVPYLLAATFTGKIVFWFTLPVLIAVYITCISVFRRCNKFKTLFRVKRD